jgi:predicted nucleotidyltransferase component of viral defense system
MIDLLKQELAGVASVDADLRLHRVREFLQILSLKIIYDAGHFENLGFAGGTALRILYGLRRFSEDLDFSLVLKKDYSFTRLTADLKRGFELNGFHAEMEPKEDKTVHSSFIKFQGLLKELGLSALKDQKLSIKFEIDTNPPQGGHLTRTLVNKTFVFTVNHFDISSLYATKLHACFFRKYTKGRDFYDFLWYLGKKTEPNFVLLNNAIQQTQGYDPKLVPANFKAFLMEGLGRVDFLAAKKDVERFLEDKKELELFRAEIFQAGVESTYGGTEKGYFNV